MRKVLCAALAVTLLSVQVFAQDAGVGEMAPDFVLQNLAGDEVALSDFHGRVVLLNFFGYS